MNTNKSVAGKGLLVALMIVAIIGTAVAGYILYSKKAMDALPDVASTTDQSAPVEGAATDEHDAPIAAQEEPAPVEQTTTTTEQTKPAPSNIKIDVQKAFAPRTIGKADAPIKIIEYASLTCSHCAHFANEILPELKTKYVDTGKVQIEFREFPLNDPALKAALTARCLPEDKYEGFVSLLFKTQDHWAAGLDYMSALKQNAKLAGMSDDTFEACQAEPKLKEKIAADMKDGQEKWKIDATPTFIINDGKEKISGAQPLAEFERVFRKLTGDTVGAAPAVE